jgi:glycosyltransferase involved in cell wall biosynthesis
MACKRPVVLAIDGVARKLIADAKAGLFAEPENPEAFVEAIEKLKQDPKLAKKMGESGYEYAAENYCRAKLAVKYLEILTGLAEP